MRAPPTPPPLPARWLLPKALLLLCRKSSMGYRLLCPPRCCYNTCRPNHQPWVTPPPKGNLVISHQYLCSDTSGRKGCKVVFTLSSQPLSLARVLGHVPNHSGLYLSIFSRLRSRLISRVFSRRFSPTVFPIDYLPCFRPISRL